MIVPVSGTYIDIRVPLWLFGQSRDSLLCQNEEIMYTFDYHVGIISIRSWSNQATPSQKQLVQ